jgi:hypothetical protein
VVYFKFGPKQMEMVAWYFKGRINIL